MTKGELIEYLKPFTDDVNLYIWSNEQGVWRPLEAKAKYSARHGTTDIWCEPREEEEPDQPCKHIHLDMDGICHRCGEDCRSGGSTL